MCTGKFNISEPSHATPHETEWIEECKCVLHSECVTDETDASIDIRIITVHFLAEKYVLCDEIISYNF